MRQVPATGCRRLGKRGASLGNGCRVPATCTIPCSTGANVRSGFHCVLEGCQVRRCWSFLYQTQDTSAWLPRRLGSDAPASCHSICCIGQHAAHADASVPCSPDFGGVCFPDLMFGCAAPTRGGLEAAATAAVSKALEKESGDILCFLPGAGEIRQAAEARDLCSFAMSFQAAKILACPSLAPALGLRVEGRPGSSKIRLHLLRIYSTSGQEQSSQQHGVVLQEGATAAGGLQNPQGQHSNPVSVWQPAI